MGFDHDLSGWTVGVPIDRDPCGTWNVQWSSDYGGSAEIYASGAPAATNIAQATQCAIMPGDQLTVDVFHTNLGNFSNWYVLVNGTKVLEHELAAEGSESLTWTADRVYDPGTVIMLGTSVWPGSSTTWFESVEYTPAVPEPSTVIVRSLLGGIGIVIGWRRKRAA